MARPAGSGSPTLIERWIGIIPLPFVLAAAVWAGLFVLVVPVVGAYADTRSLDEALRTTFAYYCGPTCSPLQQGTSLVTQFLFFFLPGTMARRMRLSVLRTKPALSMIHSKGKDAPVSVFEAISRKLPQVLIAALLFAFFALTSSEGGSSGSFFDSLSTFSDVFSLLAFGSLVWTYFVGLGGIHKFGGSYLSLRPPSMDASQGARPLGSLALALAASYFSLVAVGLVTALTLPFTFSGELLIGGLTVFGVIMFFLPLNIIHEKMRDNKAAELASVHGQLVELARDASTGGQKASENGTSRVERLMALEILDRKTSAAHTWPFDTGILGRFLAVALSVTAILLATVIRELFGI